MRARVAPSISRASDVRVVMREVGGDDDQRFRAAPQPLDHLRDLRHARVTDGERHERELAQLALQEGQLHFQRVLLEVRRRRSPPPAADRARARAPRWSIGTCAERRGEGLSVGIARPRTGTRCTGPSSTTRFTRPRAGASSS